MLVGAAISYRTYRHHEISKTTTIDPTDGVDEALFASIGGIDQWITIRGQRRDNPVVLIVHGGPGFALSPLPRSTFFDWTRAFTLVQWDQRGAGKTFGRSGPVGSDVTIERMARDGAEVAAFVRAKLHKQKIILVGVSWGASLGVRIAKSRPDLLYAYVGSGQSINQHRFKIIGYRQLLAEARARDDRRAIRELDSIGPPPYGSMSSETVYTKWATAYERGTPSRLTAISTLLFDSVASITDIRDYIKGIASSDNQFREQIRHADVTALGTDFAVPFFVFQGADDNVTPVQPVRDYFELVQAPHKELVLIPHAGHNVIATESREFLRLLTDRVRPLAIQESTPRDPQ